MDIKSLAFTVDGERLVTIGPNPRLSVLSVLLSAYGTLPVARTCPPHLTELAQKHQGIQTPFSEWKVPTSKLMANATTQPHKAKWHWQQAEDSEVTDQWFAARWHVDRLLELKEQPATILYFRRAEANNALEKFEDALNDYSKVIQEAAKRKDASITVAAYRCASRVQASRFGTVPGHTGGRKRLARLRRLFADHGRSRSAPIGWPRDYLHSLRNLGDAMVVHGHPGRTRPCNAV